MISLNYCFFLFFFFNYQALKLFSGVFTCGPASVKAIRQGELFYGYDTKFMFAEVHGDRVHWTLDHEGNMNPIFIEKKVIGKCISTKAVSTISREDLTNNYKYPEGLLTCMVYRV